MLADPDKQKVRELIIKLSNYYWSKQLPEKCLLPDGSGVGRIAYDDMEAFNVAWCYHMPTDHTGHTQAIVSSVLLRKILDEKHGSMRFRDAVGLLSRDAFNLWMRKHKDSIDEKVYAMVSVASNNRHSF